MQRITISLDDPLAGALDGFLETTGYRSRSEGVRDIVRDAMGRHNNDVVAHKHSVANLSYIYDRRVRRLASRLSEMQHAHHDLIASATSFPQNLAAPSSGPSALRFPGCCYDLAETRWPTR